MKKKVVFFLYDLSIGGTEQVVVKLSNYLLNKGYQIELLLINNKNLFEDKIHQEVDITSFNVTKISQSLVPLIKFIKTTKLDFFISNVWPVTVVSVLAFLFKPSLLNKLILVEHCHLKEEFKEKSLFFKFFQFVSIAIFYNFSNKVISVSEGVSQNLITKGVRKTKNVVIHNPAYVEQKLFKPKFPEGIKDWLDGNYVKLISVGNFKTQKNYPNLIKAMGILKNAKDLKYKLLIVGDGYQRSTIEREIAEQGVAKNVTLLGSFPEATSLINLSDIFVLPSDFEGFGLVIVEALSVGKTVVSTDCKSGPAEIIGDNEFGYLCKVNDPVDLAEKIKFSAINRLDEKKLKKRAKDFSIEIIGPKYEDILRKIRN